MIEALKDKWFALISKYSFSEILATQLWNELIKNYSHKNRHYHSLSHIDNMINQAEVIQDSISNYDAFLFAIWYHDIIYKSSKNDNEEKSADFCKNKLKSLKIDEKTIDNIQKLILSTKKHQIILSNNNDNAYLLDIDLSILGSDWNTYLEYTQNIRKEYAIFPNFIYNKGRKKVLNNFLERDTLYFTKDYKNEYEKQARENLKKEIELL